MLRYKIYSLAGSLWHDDLPQGEAHERLAFYEGPDAVAALERFVAGRHWPKHSLAFKKRVFVCVNEVEPAARSCIAYPFNAPGVFVSSYNKLSVARLEQIHKEPDRVVDLPARKPAPVDTPNPATGIIAAAFAAALSRAGR